VKERKKWYGIYWLFLFCEKEDGGIVRAKQATLIPFSDYSLIKVQVKQSHYRPGGAQRVPRS